MAAQDLQIQPRRPNYLAQQDHTAGRSPIQTAHGVGTSGDSPSLLLSALLHRWWVFLLIGIASTFAGWEVMRQFGKDSSRSTAALIQTGLPHAPDGGEVIKSMAPTTCAELIESVNILNKLCESRGIDISPKILQELIETKTTRGSSLLSIEFAWSKAADGVAILNELLDIFVEEVAEQRKRTLQNHMGHVERALLQSRAEVSDARQQILEVQAEQKKVLEEGGLNSERYRSVLSSVSNTELAVDEKRVEQLGVMQQIEVIEKKSADLDQAGLQLFEEFKSQLANKIKQRLTRVREQITSSSPVYTALTALISEVTDFVDSEDAPQDPQLWQTELYSLVTESEVRLPVSELEEFNATFDAQLGAYAIALKEIDDQRQQLSKQQEQLELSVIPLRNQITMLETRLADYQKQADDISQQLTGIGADQYGAYELRLEQAEGQQKALTAQLDNMSQLEKCRVREWTISVPASLETTEVSSNRTKLFALGFALCGLVLSTPVLASEWFGRQSSPQVAFANSLHLPVLAERILQDFAPSRRNRLAPPRLSDEQLEAVRMLALRIQQSAHIDGSVILFSSIDSSYSPAALMASIAECLSQREEKVLIIDAVCPTKSRMPITNVIPMPASSSDASKPATEENSALDWTQQPGLAEYFSTGCDSVNELIQHTGCPGVDLISSGHAVFPREALASSSLTELVECCRENYTMILVNSPTATASADLQMLTARADGVVLMATKEVGKNPRAHEAIADLIDLGAPIIGVVA